MANSTSLYQLLRHYAASPGDESWVAASVVTKYQSSYRKPGALMLVSPLGQALGLISGGCLESDIVLQARRVLHSGQARYVIYDSMEEGNIAAELGLGCNGRVGVLVQALGQDHRELLVTLLQRLETRCRSRLLYCFESDQAEALNSLVLLDDANREIMKAGSRPALPYLPHPSDGGHRLLSGEARQWSLVTHNPPVSLWIIGGGVDARPVVAMAAMLGWRVTVVDHRITQGRPHLFPGAGNFIRQAAGDFDGVIDADAALVMSHNQQMDADWLGRLSHCPALKYIGLLGPLSRKAEVLAMAGLVPGSDFARSVHGPMGFDIGGDLPESVALSALAQCHRELAAANCL